MPATRLFKVTARTPIKVDLLGIFISLKYKFYLKGCLKFVPKMSGAHSLHGLPPQNCCESKALLTLTASLTIFSIGFDAVTTALVTVLLAGEKAVS